MNEIIRLYVSPERFVLAPLSQKTTSSSALEIDRASGKITPTQARFGVQDQIQDIFGIIGIVKLLSGPYLLVITGRRCVGRINGAEIWKVTRTKLYPYVQEALLTPAQKEDEAKYLRMIEWVLSVDGFYFSYSYDLTHTIQRVYSMPAEEKAKPLWARCDQRFFWNRHLMNYFIFAQLDAWILPITMGFVQIESCKINNMTFEYALISRRSSKRVGTRFNVRGVDSEGNVANSVETEQLVFYNNMVSSFVQTRGSIPLFWKQTPTLKYKPRPQLFGQGIETGAAVRRHFDELVRLYHKVVIINLIDQKGSELALGEGYENNVRMLNTTAAKYVAFDFHHQCRKMRYDRLSTLIDQVSDDMQKHSFFYAVNDKTELRQEGVFRTNCIDNLDRTNVVQSLLARQCLVGQFIKLGIFRDASSQKVADYPQFEALFRNVWANNADVLSMQYSGTGALKADFTRTGKRSWQGVLNDAANSTTRYILNNFFDGFRQDALDLFVGNYVVDTQTRSPFTKSEKWLLYAALSFIAVLFFVSAMIPSDNWTYTFLTAALWIVFLFVGFNLLMRNGRRFVDKPVLFLKD